MKKFTVPCNFGGANSPFTVYIGAPEDNHHPLHFQAEWLSKERGGQVPQEVMESIAKLKDLANRNNVSLEELCVYALGSALKDADSEENNDNEEDLELNLDDDNNDDDLEISEDALSEADNNEDNKI